MEPQGNMGDLNKMDRTWLCSVVFMDIANYSSQSVELQMKWKQRFNGYLTEAIQNVPESERVILDTGDGAAICFLGAPEAAMFAALQLSQSFVLDERDNKPGLSVRLGINLGPVKLVRDINGALNAIGDGINAGQRIMSFASANKILVSQSFFEVVSRLSDDYKPLFQLKGVEKDKHVREHTVYHLMPPIAEHAPMVENAQGQAMPSTPTLATNVAPTAPIPAPRIVAPGAQPRAPGSGLIIGLSVAGVVLVALAAAIGWRVYGPGAAPKANDNAAAQSQFNSAPVSPAPAVAAPAPVAPPAAAPPAVAPSPSAPNPAPPLPDKPASAAPADKTPKSDAPRVVKSQPEKMPASTPAASGDPARLLQEAKDQLAQHNDGNARELFRKAADAGSLPAAVLLGTLYAQGIGGEKSDGDAVRMFRQAADLGNARGMYNLGLMYEAGRTVPAGPDNRSAAHWYTEASNRGDRDAAFRLGVMYEEGRGVAKDLNEARRLYGKAGTPDAMMRKSKLPPE